MNKKTLLLRIFAIALMLQAASLRADCDVADDVPCPYENSEHSMHHHHGRGSGESTERYTRSTDSGPLRHNRSGYSYANPVGLREDDENFKDSYKPIRQNFEDYNDSEWDYPYYSNYYSYKSPTYVDYLPPYYRAYPYYLGYKNGPFFGNGYGF